MAWLFEGFWFRMKAKGMVLAHRDMEGFHVLSVAQGLFGIIFSIAYEKAISCKSLLSGNQCLTFTQLNQRLIGNLQGAITKHIPLWGWGDNGYKTNRRPRLCPAGTWSLCPVHKEDSVWITGSKACMEFPWGYESQSVLDRWSKQGLRREATYHVAKQRMGNCYQDMLYVFKVLLCHKHTTSLWIKTLLQTLFYSLYIPLRQENPHPFLTEELMF